MTNQLTYTPSKPSDASNHLTDMHCHLAFAKDAELLASQLSEARLPIFANTVEPENWEWCTNTFDSYSNITVGYGWHPWWIKADSSPQKLFDALEHFQPHALGEIGLDFGPQHSTTKEQQVSIFQTFAKWAAAKQNCLLSIHAVQATSKVLELLGNLHVFDTCKCIFHWFSGSSDDLNKALTAGCYFSVNQRMIRSKKGREYVRQIPLNRLLLESDLPSKPQEKLTTFELIDALEETLREISSIKETDCAASINETALQLLATVHN